jgi:hypothetical protein
VDRNLSPARLIRIFFDQRVRFWLRNTKGSAGQKFEDLTVSGALPAVLNPVQSDIYIPRCRVKGSKRTRKQANIKKQIPSLDMVFLLLIIIHNHAPLLEVHRGQLAEIGQGPKTSEETYL